jgi:catechol 2,3-dioxygenase-like lactoylglutathione lyase family enzyme
MTVTASRQSVPSGSGELPRHRRVLQESGPAAGRISGINHLVLYTYDMNEGVRFYRDLLGLRVVRTVRFTPSAEGLRSAALHSSGSAVLARTEAAPVALTMKVRQVFFEMGNGELFSLYEAPGVSTHPDAPLSGVLWPPPASEQWSRPRELQKLDHLSFDVPMHGDVEWFREHLLSQGVAVSEITERRGVNNAHRFISSIYFNDPSGNPLEIASMNASDTTWRTYDFSDWFMDEDPVPALIDAAPEQAQPLAPRWLRLSTG